MPEITASRYRVDAGWDSVPHLDETTKRQLLASTPPHLRDARTKGIPNISEGAIYPIPLEDIQVDPFEIPAWWPRSYALDVGWNRTAAIWGTTDPETQISYLYAEHYRGQAEPEIHASAIKARGAWIPGVIDPAARGRDQADGKKLVETYRSHGLDLAFAVNAVEAGLFEVWSALSTGRLKVFSTLTSFGKEYRLYRRIKKVDADGVTRTKILKKDDHLMDSSRYWWMSGRAIAKVRPVSEPAVAARVVLDELSGY